MNKVRKELFGYSMQQLSTRRDWCFWPKEECTQKAVRAHSVQNSRVLDLLCRDGHVIMPKLDLSAGKPPNCVFRPVGRNLATTFTGLCMNHDREMFRPIEMNSIRISDLQHLFLLAYRAVLKEAHDTRKSMIDLRLSFERGVANGIYPRDEPSPAGMLSLNHMMAAFQVEEVRERFDEAYRSNDWGYVDHRWFLIPSRPTVAVNSMFSTGLYSKALDGSAFVMLNVFPITRDQTAVVFSYIAEQKDEAMTAFGNIWTVERYHQQYELSKLILRKAFNTAIAPNFFDTFTVQRKETIQEYFTRNSCNHSFDLDDPGLFLFWPIGSTGA